MNEDDNTLFLESDSGCFLESMMRSRRHIDSLPDMLAKLDVLIHLELDLAIAGAEKAKSELVKKNAKDASPVRPIK
jgi:hypothetical protein